MNLWQNTPGECQEIPTITEYIPENKRSRAAFVIFPGGGYHGRANHEGELYARFLNEHGICAFVIDYRVAPHRFPLPLSDARRAVRIVRANADKYGIDRDKIAVMGSSAGGHLAALTSTYTKGIDFENIDETDNEDCMPNATILCYPVICSPDTGITSHKGSYSNLLGDKVDEMGALVDPSNNVTENTPPAFIWHTSDDPVVNVINSYTYATRLRENNVPVEMHIFPHGSHGMGLAQKDPHVSQWTGLLINWLKNLEWI